MLKIGNFSKLSRVSVRMLRHYDDIGLFKPAETDLFTGYRYYREDQLFAFARITALKDMGFSLAEITRILKDYDDPETIDRYLAQKQKELEKILEETEYRRTLLENARERLRSGENRHYDVNIRTLPERCAAVIRMVIPAYAKEGMAWDMLKECGPELVPAEPFLAAAEFLDPEYKENNISIRCWMAVRRPFPDTEHVKCEILPPLKTAGCIMTGGYEQLNGAIAALAAWIRSGGYQITGPMFNIYHVGPAQTDRPEEYVTEVCFPVE